MSDNMRIVGFDELESLWRDDELGAQWQDDFGTFLSSWQVNMEELAFTLDLPDFGYVDLSDRLQ